MMRLLVVLVVLTLCQLGSAFTGPSAFGAVARPTAAIQMKDSLATELRAKSDEELAAEIDAAKAELYDMRHKRATRQTVKTSDYDAAKYKVALASTILSERK
mmetsp:Transcript_4605/g.11869  ORF Transcript_4605/g.11869 Transcript_4605/m.11869 type:complete len:102 (+) Transcript_4605:42-347(+)